MARKKLSATKVKKVVSFGVTTKVALTFSKRCKELGVTKSVIIEELMKEFLK